MSLVIATANLFKVPVRLRINKSYFLSSRTGEFMSTLIYIYLLYNLILSDSFTKNNPQIMQNEVETVKTATFDFNSDNFAFMVGIASLSGFYVEIDPRYLRIYAEYVQLAANPVTQNFDIVEFKKVSMTKCKESIVGKQYPDLIRQYPAALCLPNTTFSVSGSYAESTYQFLEISVEMCNNKTMNNSCKPQTEIDAFITGKFLGLGQTESFFSSDDYKHPFQTKISSKFFALDTRMRKMYKASFYKMSVVDDDGLFTSTNKLHETWKIGDSEIDIDLNPHIQLASILYMATNKGIKYKRTYMKLQGELGSLGGITSIFIFVGNLLISFSPFGVMEIFLSKHLFSFQNLNKKKKRPNKHNTVKSKNSLSTNRMKTLGIQETPEKVNQLDDESPVSQQKRQSLFIEDLNKNCGENENEKFKTQIKHYFSSSDTPKGQDKYISPELPLESEPKSILNTNMSKLDSLLSKELSIDNNLKNTSKIKPLFGDEPILLEGISNNSQTSAIKKTMESTFSKKLGSTTPKKLKSIKENSFLDSFRIFTKHKIQKDGITLKLCDLCDKEKRTQFFNKLKALRIATSKINNDLDIITVLQRFQELDKLKLLLLNKNQLMLFNLIAKPEIFINEKETMEKTPGLEISKNLKSLNEIDNQSFLDLANYYHAIKIKQSDDDLDARLVRLVDQDMKEYFGV